MWIWKFDVRRDLHHQDVWWRWRWLLQCEVHYALLKSTATWIDVKLCFESFGSRKGSEVHQTWADYLLPKHDRARAHLQSLAFSSFKLLCRKYCAYGRWTFAEWTETRHLSEVLYRLHLVSVCKLIVFSSTQSKTALSLCGSYAGECIVSALPFCVFCTSPRPRRSHKNVLT